MKSKKFVSLLLAACLSLSAMTVNAWAENGGENKEVPAPVVQEVEGEDKKDQETKPEEPKTEETGEGENKETNKDETKETYKDENKAGEGEDKKNEETKPADPSAAVAYGTAAVAMALNNGNSNPPVDNEPFSESTVTVVKHIKSLPDKPLTNEDFVKIMGQLERNPLTISFNNEKFEASHDKRAADGWKWEPQPFDGTVTEGNVTETGNEVEGYDIASCRVDVKKETSTSTTVTVVNYYTKKEVTPTGNFTIVKVDKENPNTRLPGATFNLYREAGHALIQKVTTNANGEAEFKEIPAGKYLLTEIQAPADYQNPKEYYTVQVTENNGKFEVSIEPLRNLDESGGYVFQITNTKTQTAGNFTITKVDAANHDLKLTGAEFTLKKFGAEGEGTTKATDKDGKVTFDNLEKGTYILKETKAPEDYQESSATYNVEVGENGNIEMKIVSGNYSYDIEGVDKTFTITNTKKVVPTTSYTFMKHGVVTTVDSNGRTIRTTESPLAGAEFTLYDAEENMLQTVRSAADGSVTFSNLIDDGYYIIKETKAPSGYTGWNGRIKLSVHFDEQGKPEIRVLVEYLSENREENITGELTVRNYTTVKETEHPVDNRYDDDDDYVLPTVTRKDNKKPANKPERAPRVEEVIPSKRNPETGNSSSMPIAMAAAAVSLTGLVVLCKKKDK